MAENENFILKGQICYSKELGRMEVYENSYLVCKQGICGGVYQQTPEEYQHFKLIDCQDQIIIPGLVDLHIHAPQYTFRALNMDLELLDWLNTNTFPEEAKYADLEYAKKAYTIFADKLKSSATTRACVFGTIHSQSTELLMELLDQRGLKAYVGRVNMDRNSPANLIEKGADASVQATIEWLEKVSGKYPNMKPILTPRFIPSCSDELMERLGEIQKEYQLPLQSHLSENPEEVRWVKKLCPEAEFYGDAYDRFGLFGNHGQTIMAHCVHSDEQEQIRIKERGVYIAHCPGSNTNLSSGIAPVREFLERGIRIGLGTDVAGGFTESVFRAIADAVQVSKLRWRLVDSTKKPLTIEEAFYLATKGGGEFFGAVGSFENGYEFDAIVLDDKALPHPQEMTVKERLERLIYLSDDRQIQRKYVAGKQIL